MIPNTTRTKALSLLMGVAAVILGAPLHAPAQMAPFAKDGVYVGIATSYLSIGDDFDGSTVFVGDSDLVLVPKVDSDFGLKVSLGLRYPSVALEVNYLQSSHKATVAGATGDVEYRQFGGDLKILLAQQHAQPYLLIGLYFPELVLKDGSATISSVPDVADASYRGLGLNVGLGLLYYLHRRLALDIGVLYRVGLYGSAKGAAGTREPLDEPLLGGGVGVTIGGAFTF